MSDQRIKHGDVVKNRHGATYVVLELRSKEGMVGVCLYQQTEPLGTINFFSSWEESNFQVVGNISEVLELLRKHYDNKKV